MMLLVAYTLAGDDALKVDNLRKDIAEKFRVHDALRLPPHITVFRPFQVKEETVPEVEKAVELAAKKFKRFELGVRGFNHFDKNVWFIDVEQKKEFLDLKFDVFSRLNHIGISEAQEFGNRHHFHITLAYRDVTPDAFRKIGEYLQDMECPINSLTIDSLTILEHDGNQWFLRKEFALGV